LEDDVRYTEAEGLSRIEACEVLKGLAFNVPSSQVIVEIGVYRGRSLMALAEGAWEGSGAMVYGIDPWNLPRPSKPKYASDETYEVALNNCHASIANEHITLIRGFSCAVAENWLPEDGKIGLWYLDADHRKLPVLADFSAWQPHMAPDALVCFDDHHADFPGVIEAVNCLWQKGRITRPQMMTDRLAVSRLL
jgi:predicted O-methyltransferase YrrM